MGLLHHHEIVQDNLHESPHNQPVCHHTIRIILKCQTRPSKRERGKDSPYLVSGLYIFYQGVCLVVIRISRIYSSLKRQFNLMENYETMPPVHLNLVENVKWQSGGNAMVAIFNLFCVKQLLQIEVVEED